jgi:transcriptional adapter 2-alpha
MPLRGEFDVEYDNEAELLLAEMEFLEEDTKDEIQSKYSILEIYNRRLKEREKRKRFVIDRNILNLKKKFEREKLMSKTERKIQNMLKPYARFLEPSQFEELSQALCQEVKYKELIDNLTALNLNG